MEAPDSGSNDREHWQYRQTIGEDVVGTLWLTGGRLCPLPYAIAVHTRGLHCIASHDRRTIGRVQGFTPYHPHVTALWKEGTCNVEVLPFRYGSSIDGWPRRS
jgi:hypothetical protein